jgi:hypothetical protein
MWVVLIIALFSSNSSRFCANPISVVSVVLFRLSYRETLEYCDDTTDNCFKTCQPVYYRANGPRELIRLINMSVAGLRDPALKG